MVIVVPAIAAVLLAGQLINGVSLNALQWLSIVVLLWLGTLPFTLLGLANGYLLSGQTAGVVNFGANIGLAVIGRAVAADHDLPGLAEVDQRPGRRRTRTRICPGGSRSVMPPARNRSLSWLDGLWLSASTRSTRTGERGGMPDNSDRRPRRPRDEAERRLVDGPATLTADR